MRLPKLMPSIEERARGAAIALGHEVHSAHDRAAWLELRERDVTASVAGCLFGDGVHDYVTRYGLWALKSGRLRGDPEETDAMRRGRLLEPVAVQLLRELRPAWLVQPSLTYFRAPAARIGATPDAFAIDPERTGFGVIQIKSVEPSVFRRKWIDPDTGDVAPPLWIAVQAIVEATLTGASWCCVAPLRVGFGVDLDVIDVPIKQALWSRLVEETAAFWSLVDSGQTPEPDYKRDAATIAAIYNDDDGREIDLAGDARIEAIMAERAKLKEIEAAAKQAAEARRVIDAEIISRLGNASAGRLADGTIVSARTTRRPAVTMPPTQFRTVRVRPAAGKRHAIADELETLF